MHCDSRLMAIRQIELTMHHTMLRLWFVDTKNFKSNFIKLWLNCWKGEPIWLQFPYTALVVNPYTLYYFNFEENLNFTELEKYIHQENGTHFIALRNSLQFSALLLWNKTMENGAVDTLGQGSTEGQFLKLGRTY